MTGIVQRRENKSLDNVQSAAYFNSHDDQTRSEFY